MSAEFDVSVKATMEDAARIAGSVEEFLTEHEVDPEATYAVVLTIEELVTNTAKFGLRPGLDDQVRIQIKAGPDGVELRLEDAGVGYDPFSAPEPDLDQPVEDRPIGGLGIHLIRKLSHYRDYQRLGERNIVTVRFGGGSP